MEYQYLNCTKEEVCAVIRFFYFQNVSLIEIHRKITKVYGPRAMLRKSVFVRYSKFNLGRESVEDEARKATQIDLQKTTVHFLFGPLKKFLGETYFQNEDEAMNTVVEYFNEKRTWYFRDGIFKFLHRRENCINLNVGYVEK